MAQLFTTVGNAIVQSGQLIDSWSRPQSGADARGQFKLEQEQFQGAVAGYLGQVESENTILVGSLRNNTTLDPDLAEKVRTLTGKDWDLATPIERGALGRTYIHSRLNQIKNKETAKEWVQGFRKYQQAEVTFNEGYNKLIDGWTSGVNLQYADTSKGRMATLDTFGIKREYEEVFSEELGTEVFMSRDARQNGTMAQPFLYSNNEMAAMAYTLAFAASEQVDMDGPEAGMPLNHAEYKQKFGALARSFPKTARDYEFLVAEKAIKHHNNAQRANAALDPKNPEGFGMEYLKFQRQFPDKNDPGYDHAKGKLRKKAVKLFVTDSAEYDLFATETVSQFRGIFAAVGNEQEYKKNRGLLQAAGLLEKLSTFDPESAQDFAKVITGEAGRGYVTPMGDVYLNNQKIDAGLNQSTEAGRLALINNLEGVALEMIQELAKNSLARQVKASNALAQYDNLFESEEDLKRAMASYDVVITRLENLEQNIRDAAKAAREFNVTDIDAKAVEDTLRGYRARNELEVSQALSSMLEADPDLAEKLAQAGVLEKTAKAALLERMRQSQANMLKQSDFSGFPMSVFTDIKALRSSLEKRDRAMSTPGKVLTDAEKIEFRRLQEQGDAMQTKMWEAWLRIGKLRDDALQAKVFDPSGATSDYYQRKATVAHGFLIFSLLEGEDVFGTYKPSGEGAPKGIRERVFGTQYNVIKNNEKVQALLTKMRTVLDYYESGKAYGTDAEGAAFEFGVNALATQGGNAMVDRDREANQAALRYLGEQFDAMGAEDPGFINSLNEGAKEIFRSIQEMAQELKDTTDGLLNGGN